MARRVFSSPAAALLICASVAQALVVDRQARDDQATVPTAQLRRRALDVGNKQNHLYWPLRGRLEKQAATKPPVVYFFGDSTMRNQWLAFCSLLRADKPGEIADPNPEGGAVMRLEEHHKVASRNYCNSTIGAAFLYHTWEQMNPGFVEEVMSWGYPAPTGIYLNTGLHVLRGLGPRGMGWNKQKYEEFRDLESIYTSTVHRCLQVAPSAKVAVMLSHCICESLFSGEWGRQVTDYNENPVKATQNCSTGLQAEGIDAVAAQLACVDSAFMRRNIKLLNDRLLAANTHAGLRGEAPGVVDAFSVTDDRCNSTFDGVHYNYHVLNELSMLFDALKFA